jgi:hypothetical protein
MGSQRTHTFQWAYGWTCASPSWVYEDWCLGIHGFTNTFGILWRAHDQFSAKDNGPIATSYLLPRALGKAFLSWLKINGDYKQLIYSNRWFGPILHQWTMSSLSPFVNSVVNLCLLIPSVSLWVISRSWQNHCTTSHAVARSQLTSCNSPYPQGHGRS